MSALRLRTEALTELRPAELASVAGAAQATIGYHCFSLVDCPLKTVLNTQLC